MKADWDDAPDHIKRKTSKFPIGIASLTAICLIGGILIMADRNGWVEYAQNLANPPQPANQQHIAANRPAETRHSTPTPSPEDTFWEQVGNERQQSSAANTNSAVRQTSFNDSNYRPRPAVNTMPPPAQQHYAQAQTRPALGQQQGLNGSNRVRLTWQDGRREKSFWWEGPYRWSNSVINYDALCKSENFPRKGSIEYRACRRAAKDYLRNECRSGRSKTQEMRRVYCHAENAFRH